MREGRRAMNHAPAVGYGFEAKQRYRKQLWGWIDDQLAHKVPRSKRVVAYLDTREAHETVFLLNRGYAADNLHAVNVNPVEVALLTKRLDSLGLPRVKTHGIDYVRTLSEANVPKWHVMSFDGCGPISSPNTMRCVLKMSRMASPGVVLAANVLCGRDTGSVSLALREAKENGEDTKARRYAWLLNALCGCLSGAGLSTDFHVAASRKGQYLSASGQPMLWMAVKLKAGETSFRRQLSVASNGRDELTMFKERHAANNPIGRRPFYSCRRPGWRMSELVQAARDAEGVWGRALDALESVVRQQNAADSETLKVGEHERALDE